jgi:hypothetical protein
MSLSACVNALIAGLSDCVQAALIRQVTQRVASIFSEPINATANSHSQDPICNYSPSVFKFVFQGDELFVGHAKASFFWNGTMLWNMTR